MNRTVAREAFPAEGMRTGEVLVATMVDHPDRGLAQCPAAPLVGATAARPGLRIRYGPITAPGTPQDGVGVVFVTSYVGRDGAVIALAAAAASTDPVALDAAREAVAAWSDVLRTRRVLRGAIGPLCPGARRALGMVDRIRADGPVHVLGRLAGGFRRDTTQVTDLAEVPDGAPVVFPAHGVPLAVRAEAAARGLRVIDATCPLVEATHAEAARFAQDGDTVVLIGRSGHAALPGLMGQAPERTVMVQTLRDVGALDVADPARVSYLIQPGLPIEETAPIAAALRARFPVRGRHPDGLCHAASDRAETVRTIAGAADVLLVLGAPDPALAGPTRGTRTHHIRDVTELRPDWLADAATIGLVEAGTARPETAGQVIAALSGLGPLSVAERRVTTEITGVPAALATPAAPAAPLPVH